MKKLYVGNLSFKATEEEVQALFTEAGVQPDSLTLLRDRFTGQPRGFGSAARSLVPEELGSHARPA